ncbi:MAG: hypothetical protein WDZ41_01030 [Candidatus Babeliales bacterium]
MKLTLKFLYLFLLFFWVSTYPMEESKQKNKLTATKRGSLSVDNYSQLQLTKILEKQKNEIEFLCNQIESPKPTHKHVLNFMYQISGLISDLILNIEKNAKENHPTKTIDQSEINNILQEKLSNLGSHLLQKTSKKMKALQKTTNSTKKELYYCHTYFYLNCFDIIQTIFITYGFKFNKQIKNKTIESKCKFWHLQSAIWPSLLKKHKEEKELYRAKKLIPILLLAEDFYLQRDLEKNWAAQHQYFQSLKQAELVILDKKNKSTSKITRTRSGAISFE